MIEHLDYVGPDLLIQGFYDVALQTELRERGVSRRWKAGRKGETDETNRFTEEQIVAILKQSEAGMKTVEVCRQNGIREATAASRDLLVTSRGFRMDILLAGTPILPSGLSLERFPPGERHWTS